MGLNQQALGCSIHFEVSSFFAFWNGTDFEEYVTEIYEIPLWLTFFVLLSFHVALVWDMNFSIADFIQVEVLQTTLHFQKPGHEFYKGLQCASKQKL